MQKAKIKQSKIKNLLNNIIETFLTTGTEIKNEKNNSFNKCKYLCITTHKLT
jgi:hypothetical protein